MYIAKTIDTTGNRLNTTVTEDHFGTGYEFVAYDNPNYQIDEIFDLIQPTILRYPGGTATENHFDPASPNDTFRPGEFAGNGTNVVPLSDFLQIADDQNAEVIIVIPTWRYFDESTGDFERDANGKPIAKNEIKTFVKKLLAGDYGPADVLAFEVGNEWFNENFTWTPMQFGDISSQIAKWIKEAIVESGVTDAPKILVQTSSQAEVDANDDGIDDINEAILGEYGSVERAAVDGFIDHYYLGTKRFDANGDGLTDENDDQFISALDYDPTIASTRLENVEQAASAVNWSTSGLDYVTTEWNVRADRPGSITGFERLPLFLGHFADMIQSGVDLATVWTTQATGTSNGSLSQQFEDELTPTGYLFRLLKNALNGTNLIDVKNNDLHIDRDDYLVTTAGGTELGYSYTFKSDTDEKVVVYFASAVNGTVDITSTIQDLKSKFPNHHIHATKIAHDPIVSATGATSPTNAAADAKLIAIDHDTLCANAVSVILQPYELIQIELTLNEGVTISGDDQNVTNDSIVGSDRADVLSGHNGADTLIGESGNDTLDGGGGSDSLKGLNGKDLLHGRSGADDLSGGAGNDTMFGNAGNDTLTSGGGNDSLEGGENNDVLSALNGSDVARGGSGHDIVNGNEGADTLFGGSGDDTLKGGDGSDKLHGGTGDDRLVGGAGQDTFVFRKGWGNDKVVDFGLVNDELELDDTLWSGTLTEAQVVSAFATVSNGNVVFDFGDGDTLTLVGVSSLSGLDALIDIV